MGIRIIGTTVPFNFIQLLSIITAYGQLILLPASHAEPGYVASGAQSRRLPASRGARGHHLPWRGISQHGDWRSLRARLCGIKSGRRGSGHEMALRLLSAGRRLDGTERRTSHLGALISPEHSAVLSSLYGLYGLSGRPCGLLYGRCEA